MRSSLRPSLVFFCVLLVAFGVYTLGLPGWFVLDDAPNIVVNSGVQIEDLSPDSLRQAAFSRAMGLESRAVSMISFALNYYVSGLDAKSFKLTNIFLHLLTGVGLCVFGIMLLRAWSRYARIELPERQILWVGVAAASAWLLHPINLTSVLYVVQRMTILANLFMVLGLLLYVWGRSRICEGKKGLLPIFLGFAVCTPLAFLSKPNGILLPVYAGLIEYFVFQGLAKKYIHKKILVALFTSVLVIPIVIVAAYVVIHPEFITGEYIRREFTMSERLMTESRIIWFYLQMMLIPNNAKLGIYHDDVIVSSSLLDPVSTLFAVLGIGLLLGGAVWLRRRASIVSFGILFFFIGHLLESTVVGLELVYEHRNYLSSYGILLVVFYYLLHPIRFPGTVKMRRVSAVLIVVMFGLATAVRADSWSEFFTHGLVEVSHHPLSPRANHRMGMVYIALVEKDPENFDSHYRRAREYFEKAISLNPNHTGGLFELITLNAIHDKPVEQQWIEELENRLRTRPFSAQSIALLTALTECIGKGPCQELKQATGRFMDAAVANPTLLGTRRAMVLIWKSYFVAAFENRNEEALALAREAVRLSPRVVRFRLHEAVVLGRMRKFDLAREALNQAREVDRFDAFTREISMEQKRLEKAEIKAGHRS